MLHHSHFGLALGLFCLCAPLALAEQTPQPLPHDARMRTVAYGPDDVVTLTAHQLIQTSVQFSPSETILGVESGDATAWSLAVNPYLPYILFLKPAADASETHLVVLTDRNVYHFHLAVADDTDKTADMLYNVRFTYPLDEKAAATALALAQTAQKNKVASDKRPEKQGPAATLNTQYYFSQRCDTAFVPAHVFDDGTFTYFQFAPHTDVPAIFKVDAHGKEQPVNWQAQDHYVVVEQTAQQFSLRQGNAVTCIINGAHRGGDPL